MAGVVHSSDESYSHFNDGFNSRVNPMSAIDKSILNFAMTLAENPVRKTHGQIVRNFGMHPPEFWTRAQRLSDHPDISPENKERLSTIFPRTEQP
jgi:hypothetical protein